MSRVASEANVLSHHHGLTPRRPAEAKPQSTPFAMLLDDAGEAPSPPDRPERARPGSASKAQPDTSARRGHENDCAEGTETGQRTAPAEVSAEATAEDNAVAEAKAEAEAAEAKAAEAEAADGLSDEELPVAADVVETAVLAIEIDTAPAPAPVTTEPAPTPAVLAVEIDSAPAPVTTEPAPVPALPGVGLPTAEAAVDATGTDVAESDGTTILAVTALGQPAAREAEAREPAGRKVTAGSTAANGKPLDAKRSGGGEAATAALTEAVASDDEDGTEAEPNTTGKGDGGPSTTGKGEHAFVRANHVSRTTGHDAAPTPGAESSTRPPIEPQIGATADKPSADVVQLVTLQRPAERTAGANSVAPGTTHADVADQAVPIAGLALEIAARVQSGRSRFEIRLDPPELGRIDVRLDVDRSGQVTSRLVVEKAETLDLLRRDAPELERALQQAGLKTGDNGLQFALRDQTGGQNQADGARSGAARLVVADPEMAETVPGGYGRSLRLGGGIDIRV